MHSGKFHAADGDSLAIDGQRMRLKGIDAPELHQSCERAGAAWACGREARDALQRLAGTASTQCGGSEADQYGRLLVVCRSGALDINGEMVRTGMAVSYGDYGREEAAARAEKAGLWAGTFDRPRDFRDDERQHGGGVMRLIGQAVGWE
jgi:endonuclease YncB( thermonuclease family)